MNQETLAQFWSRVDKTPGHGPKGDCWIWTGRIDNSKRGGYGWFGKNQRTHRLSWVIANGIIPDGLQVLHHCDIRPCVNPSHLFLGTNQDNVDDKVAKGRHPRGALAASYANPARGEDNGNAIFSDEDVIEMRRLYSEGVRIPKIAEKYGSQQHIINMIVHGERWAHLPGALPPHKSILYENKILEMKAKGILQTEIGKILGFSDAAISRAINRKNLGVISKTWIIDNETSLTSSL